AEGGERAGQARHVWLSAPSPGTHTKRDQDPGQGRQAEDPLGRRDLERARMDTIERDQARIVAAEEVPEDEPGRVLAPSGDRPRGDQPQRVAPEVESQLRWIV